MNREADPWRDALRAGEAVGARYALEPPQRAASGLIGAQLAARQGSSIEFMDDRPYQPGDDLRRLDWAAYGRSDRLMVRLYREEVSPHLEVLIDGSRSMALEGDAKASAAMALAACLATAAANSGHTCSAWFAGDRFEPISRDAARPTAWAAPPFTGERTLAALLDAHGPPWRRRTVRIVISDLLWREEPMPVLRRLTEAAAGLVVLQVLGQADVEPPATGNVRLIDAETGERRELYVDALIQRRYAENLRAHQARWAQAARAVGAGLHRFVAEPLLADWDLRPLIEARILRVK